MYGITHDADSSVLYKAFANKYTACYHQRFVNGLTDGTPGLDIERQMRPFPFVRSCPPSTDFESGVLINL